MKNAMKKLMSVLLVAVLLISAVPFAAFADDDNGENLIAPQSNEQVEITVNLSFNDGSATQSYRQPIPVGTTVSGVLKYCMGEAPANALMAKYKRNVGNYDDVAVFEDTTVLDLLFEINTNAVNVKVYADTTTEGNIYNLPYGTVLNLGSDILSRAGMSIPADRAIDYIKVNGVQYTASSITVTSYTTVEVYTKIVNSSSNNSSNNNNSSSNNTTTTAAYVDVILVTNKTSGFVDGEFQRCYLVNGHITKTDRDAVASKISGKNIVAWKRGDGVGDPVSTLLDFNLTGLANPINILPVVGTTTNSGSNNSNTNNSGISTKDNTNQVWLHVYINGNAGTIDKSINLTSTYLMDDKKTNTTEILNYLLTNYYKAKDTSKNVELDGLYVANGTFPQSYYTNDKTAELNDISTRLESGYVHINVMLKNVTAKTTTTSTADSSNPKTGDSIYTAMTVMGISAATLAAVMYVYTKKRQAI